jgi:hypothetical protein
MLDQCLHQRLGCPSASASARNRDGTAIAFVATKLCGMKDAAKHKRLARHSPTSSFAGVQLFGVLAGRVVSGAAVFNPSDFGGNDLARVGDLVVDFVLDPALWRDLNG